VSHCLTQTIKFIRLKGNSGKVGKKEEIFKKMIGKKGLLKIYALFNQSRVSGK